MTPDRYTFSPRTPDRERLPWITADVLETSPPRIQLTDQLGTVRIWPGDLLTRAHPEPIGNHILCRVGGFLVLTDLHDLTPATA